MKIKYSIDPDNRLFMQRDNESIVLDGEFSVDDENRLNFWLNEPSEWRRRYDLPETLVFDGSWTFNNNYDLELILKQDEAIFEKSTLSLKGQIISPTDDKLVFEVASLDKNGSNKIRLIKLSGTWQADDLNQLFFSVEKKDSAQPIIMRGSWQVNKNQQITYTFPTSVVTFSGFWQISSKNRLTYVLSSGAGSRFDFKVAIQTPNVYPQEGALKYRLGMGIAEAGRNNEKIIELFGVWKLNRDLALSFDMRCEDNRIHSLEFAAIVKFDKNDEIAFALRNTANKDLGISVIFTHKFLQQSDAELFLKLKTATNELRLEGGVKIPF